MKCECKKRLAVLTCVACHKMLCTYCIQFSDHACTKVSEKIDADRKRMETSLLTSGTQPVKLQRI